MLRYASLSNYSNGVHRINSVTFFSGALATVGALSYGLWCFRSGKPKMSQNMMRLRIVAQGFTITALVLGVAMATGNTLK